jgi:hypothetical protein
VAGVKGMHKRASTSPATAEAIRARIKAGQILDRLEKHVLSGEEMTKSQVSAGLGLLKKVVPDLAATEHSFDPDKPMKGVLVWGKPE